MSHQEKIVFDTSVKLSISASMWIDIFLNKCVRVHLYAVTCYVYKFKIVLFSTFFISVP